MLDDISKSWKNAASRSIEIHTIHCETIERLQKICRDALREIQNDVASKEAAKMLWKIQYAVNQTILDFNDVSLSLELYLEKARSHLEEPVSDSLQIIIERLKDHPENPKRALLHRLLNERNLVEPILLWPRSDYTHPHSWPKQNVDQLLQDEFSQNSISWVRFLQKDLVDVTSSAIIWNPPAWSRVDEKYRLVRPFRLGLAGTTHVFGYASQGHIDVPAPLEDARFRKEKFVKPKRSSMKVSGESWQWDENARSLERVESEKPPQDEVVLNPWWVDNTPPAQTDEPVEAVCISTDEQSTVNLYRGAVVLGDGSLADCEDLEEGDLVAVTIRQGEADRTAVLERAYDINSGWKKSLTDVLREVGCNLLLEGLGQRGVKGIQPQSLRSWSGTTVLAPRGKSTFMALLDVLGDLVSSDHDLPDRREREELWSSVMEARTVQRLAGRQRHQQDMERLQEVLEKNPVEGPAYVALDDCIWHLKVCRVESIRFTECPYGALNQFKEIKSGATDT